MEPWETYYTAPVIRPFVYGCDKRGVPHTVEDVEIVDSVRYSDPPSVYWIWVRECRNCTYRET